VAGLTWGIYTPMSITVHCAAARGASGGESGGQDLSLSYFNFNFLPAPVQ